MRAAADYVEEHSLQGKWEHFKADSDDDFWGNALTDAPPRPEGALSDTAIRKAKPKAAAYQMSDGQGLFLWVRPSGGKLWRWKYRFNGLQKKASFGKWPDVSLEMARGRHLVARKLLASGADPMVQRKAERALMSMAPGDTTVTIEASQCP
jgi:hypothetical protein